MVADYHSLDSLASHASIAPPASLGPCSTSLSVSLGFSAWLGHKGGGQLAMIDPGRGTRVLLLWSCLAGVANGFWLPETFNVFARNWNCFYLAGQCF